MFSGKRLVCLVVLGLLAFSLLAGTTVAADTAPYEIKWFFPSNGPQREVELIEAEANKYLIPRINAKIKLYCFDFGSYATKMPVMIASGEPFDICFTASWTTPSYRESAAKGAFVDITDLWGVHAPKAKAQLPPAFVYGTQIDGRNYAVPANKELAHQWGFMVRTDIAEKYKMDLSSIKRLADIEPFLKVIKEREPGMIPLQNVAGETGYKALDFDRIIGDNVPGVLYNDSKDMKVFNELETPEVKAYFATARKFYLAGYVPADAATATNFSDARRAGKVFAYIGSLKPFVGEEVTAANGFPVAPVELTEPWVQTRDCTGSMQAVSRTSRDPVTVLKFLELFNTDPYLCNLILYGIEGKHYVKVSGNVIKMPEGVTRQNTGYRAGNNWVFGNQYITYVWEGENPKKWAAYKEFNDSASSAKSLGFNFDIGPVKTEVAACAAAWNEYMPGLQTGSVDPNVVLPQAIAKFRAAGVDKVIAEAQKQLNEWLKTTKK